MSEPGDDDAGSSADRMARIALTWLAEPGNRSMWSLVQSHGAPATLERLLNGDEPETAAAAIARAKANGFDPQQVADAALHRAERFGARLVVPSDEEWPERVNELATLETGRPGRLDQDTRPPLCLWVRGSWPLAETLHRSVAITGAHASTPYGVTVALDIVSGLCAKNWTVVAGGGFGIDTAAHRTALAEGGRPVAVLACGVDRPHPVGNAALFEQIAETGLLVSEWPPGFEPLRHRFLIRNRLTAAATVGAVLTEASPRSAAIQLMHRALSLRRAAMVVPGPVTSVMSAGCHELLRSHPATELVTGPADVLKALARPGRHDSAPEQRHGSLDPESAQVLQAVQQHGTATPESLATRTGLPLRTVLRRLPLLELAGLVQRTDNGVIAANRPS
ncbi:DNA-processing protein DprA [Paractinoplanes hotanensis]|uniref:DNA-protecting protein DprA n=1 Tax=Paractinoplanes hotanensis TaxID=2906497 RepID=A0ABT0XXB9_9ACTN|nr:DNA-protecting protein DprA [Actinoplanes hotanensis]MCM4078260.1 DNA-protecting protein DprA [Actinoplanes hotanensis]